MRYAGDKATPKKISTVVRCRRFTELLGDEVIALDPRMRFNELFILK